MCRPLTGTKNATKEGRPSNIWSDWGGWSVAASVLLIIAVLFSILVATGVLETGFDEYLPSSANAQRAKTVWDWMDLILVPLLLALGAGLFTWMTNKREREAEERRAQIDREADERQFQEAHKIEQDRSQEATLQTYLDRMTELMLRDDLRHATKHSEVRQVARARTLATLRELDGARKGLVLRFLSESELVSAPRWEPEPRRPTSDEVPIHLNGADFRGAQLAGALIWFCVLSKVDLTEADLSRCTVDFGDLSESVLVRAKLLGTILLGVSLANADMSQADLTGANLSGSDLCGAVLRDATLRSCHVMVKGPGKPTNLTGADLSSADLTEAVLSRADLTRANLSSATLRAAYLVGAELVAAQLCGSDLSGADLTEANLTAANLRGATVTLEQLATASSLRATIMPDGTKHE